MSGTSKLPERISAKLKSLRSLETQLGHLPPDEWSLKELSKRMENPQEHLFHARQAEEQTEMLFGDICDELLELGYAPSEIAEFINQALKFEGGPHYCNEREVRECLGLDEDSN